MSARNTNLELGTLAENHHAACWRCNVVSCLHAIVTSPRNQQKRTLSEQTPYSKITVTWIASSSSCSQAQGKFLSPSEQDYSEKGQIDTSFLFRHALAAHASKSLNWSYRLRISAHPPLAIIVFTKLLARPLQSNRYRLPILTFFRLSAQHLQPRFSRQLAPLQLWHSPKRKTRRLGVVGNRQTNRPLLIIHHLIHPTCYHAQGVLQLTTRTAATTTTWSWVQYTI